MASVTLKAYGTIASALTTELNALADSTNTVAGPAYDNSSLLDLYCDIELVLALQGSARSAGATVDVFMVTRVDGTNYGDINHQTAELVASFPLDAATTARRAVARDVPLPPERVEFFARNRTGQALAATLNTVKIRPHSLTVA